MKFAQSISRLGTESAFTVLARAGRLQAQGSDIINLGIGQPDFPTPAHIVEAGAKALRDGHHGYTPAGGLPALREAVAADLHRRHDVTVDPGRVIVVPGGKPTMFYAMLLFGEAGAEIVYPDPGFPIYRSAIEFTGATAVPYALPEATGFAFSAEDVLSKITPATRLLILNSPGNPTGGVTPRAEIDKLVAGLADHPEVVILSDEIYSQMLHGGRDHVSLLQYPEIADRVIMLDGWSKTYAMTGWRLGYAVWPEPCADPVTRLCINDHSCVNASAQHAGIAALTGPQDAVAEMRAAFERRASAACDALNALPGIRCAQPAGAFYLFPNIEGTGMTSADAQDRFLEQAGVATIAGTAFGAAGEGFVRLSAAASQDDIERAIGKIAEVLQR
ncbi:pyridoxal phosphate-dependent aminotransferase [Citreimonas sp.]|uniref:pyridoxal phosphate-dependent aminotransferase n=1 Tax=Citreimonas sp. TaxID=3036715 RepID=UPI00405A090C